MPDNAATLTPTTKLWVRLTLSFSVSVAIGLAPLLGKVSVPLFSPLLTLLPITIQNQAVTLGAVAMGLIAIIVQWTAGMEVKERWLKEMFRRSIVLAALTFVVLAIASSFLVAHVHYDGTNRSVTFAVGIVRPTPDPLCAGMSDSACIEKKLSFNPIEIESYWGDKQVKLSELLLTLTYVGFLATFGFLVGLLVLRQSLTRTTSFVNPVTPKKRSLAPKKKAIGDSSHVRRGDQ
jgi:hypothetical protein